MSSTNLPSLQSSIGQWAEGQKGESGVKARFPKTIEALKGFNVMAKDPERAVEHPGDECRDGIPSTRVRADSAKRTHCMDVWRQSSHQTIYSSLTPGSMLLPLILPDVPAHCSFQKGLETRDMVWQCHQSSHHGPCNSFHMKPRPWASQTLANSVVYNRNV